MRTSDEKGKIIPAFIKLVGALTNPRLNKVNPHFKSKYADLASIQKQLRPQLLLHEMAVCQSLNPVEKGNEVITTLWHVSGEWMESTILIPPRTDAAGDHGSSVSFMKRYALCAFVFISGDDDDDGGGADRARSRSGKSPGKAYMGAIEAIAGAGDIEALAEVDTKIRSRFGGMEQTELLALVMEKHTKLSATPDDEAGD